MGKNVQMKRMKKGKERAEEKLPKRKIPYKQLSDPTAVIEEIR